MRASENNKVIILAGGTGGHVMPALAVAKALVDQGIAVHWIGTRSGMEAKLVKAAGFPLSFIDIQGLRGKKFSAWLLAPWRITKALWQSYRILKKERPQALLSMGGYVAGPGALAGLLLGKPLIIHEQNAIPGTTNRFLARFAQQIMVAFPEVFSQYTAKVIYAGNPIRADLLHIPSPEVRLAPRADEPIRVLVLGGSQGAMRLNEVVPQAMALLDPTIRPSIIHQCGQDKIAQTEAVYAQSDIPVQIVSFIDDMAKAYSEVDVIIARSGALTVAEIAAVGVAAIFIPFPFATDDHQTANAQFLSDHGAAILLPQTDLTPQILAQHLQNFIQNPKQRLAMAMASRALGKPTATSVVAQRCIEVSHG